MKFIYLGCDGAPNTSKHFGVEFAIGEPAEVTDKDAIAKLISHPHFKAVEEAKTDAADSVGEPAAAPAGKKGAGKKVSE